MNGNGYAGLQERLNSQSLTNTDPSGVALAHYFFGTTHPTSPFFAQKSVQVAAPTGGDVRQLVRILGIGTPTVVIVEVTRVTTADTGVDHALMAAGAADGTTSICQSMRSRDAQVNDTDTGRFVWLNGLILIMNPGANTIDGQAHFVNWVLDGVEIEWDDFPASAYLLTFTFLYGSLMHGSVHHVITSGVQDGEDAVTVPYDPNVALVWYARAAYADPETSANNAFWHHGLACQNEAVLEQGCWDMTDRDARLTSGWGHGLSDDKVIVDLTQSAAGNVTVGDSLAVASFGTGEAVFVTRDGATVFNFMLVLLDVGANRRTVKVHDLDTATTGTGTNKKITASSASGTWKPKALRALGTNISV